MSTNPSSSLEDSNRDNEQTATEVQAALVPEPQDVEFSGNIPTEQTSRNFLEGFASDMMETCPLNTTEGVDNSSLPNTNATISSLLPGVNNIPPYNSNSATGPMLPSAHEVPQYNAGTPSLPSANEVPPYTGYNATEEQALVQSSSSSSQLAIPGNETGGQTIVPVEIAGGKFDNAQIGGKRIYNMTKKENIAGDVHYGTKNVQITNNYYVQGTPLAHTLLAAHATEDNRTKNITSQVKDPKSQRSQLQSDNATAGDIFHLTDTIQVHKNKPLNKRKTISYGELISSVTRAQRLAIKIFPHDEKNETEAKLLLKLKRHPNVVFFVHADVCRYGPTTCLYIAMELCHKQNLHDHVTENAKNNVPFDSQLSISQAKQLLDGLCYIHENKVIHRDLKPHNILFTNDKKTLKIADFGISKPMTSGRSITNVTNKVAGTDGYRAPETYNSNQLSRRADIYSLGLVFHFLWSNGHHAFGDDPDDWNSNIKKNRDRDLSKLLLEDQETALDLLKWCLQFDRKDRPRSVEILKHRIFGGSELSPNPETSPKEVGRLPSPTPEPKPLNESPPRPTATSSSSTVPRKEFPKRHLNPTVVGASTSATPGKTSAGFGHAKLHAESHSKSTTAFSPSPLLQKEFSATRGNTVTEYSHTKFLPKSSTTFSPSSSKYHHPEPPDMNSRWSHRDTGKEINMEKMISLKDQSELYMKHNEYSLAFDNLQQLVTYQRDAWSQMETLQQIAECQVMCDRSQFEEITEIISICKSLQLSPGEILVSADKHLEEGQLIRSYVMCICASKMHKAQSDPTDAVKGIAKCMSKMNQVLKKMTEKPRLRRIGSNHVIPYMIEMLGEFRSIEGVPSDIKVKKEATCLNKIGSCHYDLAMFKEAFEIYSEGAVFMEQEFGESVEKYNVYGSLLHNIGTTLDSMNKEAEAVPYYEKAIVAQERAEDFKSEAVKQENLEITRKFLRQNSSKKKAYGTRETAFQPNDLTSKPSTSGTASSKFPNPQRKRYSPPPYEKSRPTLSTKNEPKFTADKPSSPWKSKTNSSTFELNLQKMIELQEKSELYMKHFEYQSAYNVLKELQGLQGDSWKQFETLQQIVECLIMTDQSCDKEMNEIISKCQDLRLAPRDVHSTAEKYFDDDDLIRSYALFHCAGKMHKTGGEVEAITALTKCVSRMDDIVTKVVKRPRYRRVATRFIIPSMKELLQDLREMDYVSYEDRIIKEGDCLLFIGSGFHELSDYDSAGKYFSEGAKLLQTELGENAHKYRLLSSLLNNTGSSYFYLGHPKDALDYHQEAVRAAELAEDFSDEEHRQKSIDGFMKNINTCSRHTGQGGGRSVSFDKK